MMATGREQVASGTGAWEGWQKGAEEAFLGERERAEYTHRQAEYTHRHTDLLPKKKSLSKSPLLKGENHMILNQGVTPFHTPLQFTLPPAKHVQELNI